MPNSDRQHFRNEDLMLRVSPAVDPARWDESRYEEYLDVLCDGRGYQKESIQLTLRYWLGGRYANLRILAKENYDNDHKGMLEKRYGSWTGMERHLQLANQRSASLDLATGTGKSYVLYGIAAIMLAVGAVDRVLVLCPSLTIEAGLTEKFRELSGDSNLRDLLPVDAKVTTPRIIQASETITEGSICIENRHAILDSTGSSIRDSLEGKGSRTAVLNDEVHNVYNITKDWGDSKVKKWKEFLTNPIYGFLYILGVSGTCYLENDYFSDVIYRYSIRQAMEEKRIKSVIYVSEMPKTSQPNDYWQLIRNYHETIRRDLKKQGRDLRPLTIIVTRDISTCDDVTDELRAFLCEQEGLSADSAKVRVLRIHSKSDELDRLPYVDFSNSKVEWIVSVSMLTEGWDVKRVFQIVPHEKRAFDSKLLIAQVLGRGLRIPENWKGAQPEVTVFNHEAWASSIKHLYNEVLEIERQLPSRIISDSPYHFDLHHINYSLTTIPERKTIQSKPYDMFSKGYVDLADDDEAQDVRIEFERVGSGDQQTWKTQVKHKTYTPDKVAEDMFASYDDLPDAIAEIYRKKYPKDRLREIVLDSLRRKNNTEATETMKQTFLRSMNVLHRGEASFARWVMTENNQFTLTTRERQAQHVSAAELREIKTYFWTDLTKNSLQDEEIEFFNEVSEQASAFSKYYVSNYFLLKTPLNAVISDSSNEYKFIKELIDTENNPFIKAWIKNTSVNFYDFEYVWRKNVHTVRNKFSPDFFIHLDSPLMLVVEIKDDEEIKGPEEENIAKFKRAQEHFAQVNQHLHENGKKLQYQFNFLTPQNYGIYFQRLRKGQISGYQSDLDIRLLER
jgi:type III restriction enzyme